VSSTGLKPPAGDMPPRFSTCLLCGLLATLLAVFSSGCGRSSSAAPPVSEAPPTLPNVTVTKPEWKSLQRTIEQPGYIEAFEETPVYVKIAGYVKKVHVDIGARVRQGDLLAELSIPEMEEELQQKEASIVQAKAEVEQAEEGLNEAGANYQTAEALVREAEAARQRVEATCARWQSEYKRVQALVRNKVIDEQSQDETLNQLKASEAAKQEVEAKVQSALAARNESAARRNKKRADVNAVKARLRVAEADHRRMAALLEYRLVRAPFDGVVTRRHIHTGHFLQPASAGSTAKGEPLFVVVRTDPVRVFVDVPESEAIFIQDGAVARIHIQVLKGQEFEGRVTRTAWALEPGARTLRTEIDLPNPDGKLRPGMYAYAAISVEHARVLVVAASALTIQNDQAFCNCVENGKAVRIPVKIGVREGSLVEVVKKQRKPTKPGEHGSWEDFTGQELIIQSSSAALTEGQAVNVVPG
jgi:HlyD family secretion protein